MKRTMFAIPLAVALTLAFLASAADASTIGNTYYFEIAWLQQQYSENTGPTYHAESNGQFRVTVFNLTGSGGDDAYIYNYDGFDWDGSAVTVNQNDTVAFQDNRVYFSLTTPDRDHDNLSETPSLIVYPMRSTAHPGRTVFVNANWSIHESDWNSAVADVEEDLTVASIVESLGGGTFSFSIAVNTEMRVDMGSWNQFVNGTTTFDFSASYDSDGILSSWSFLSRRSLSGDDYTSEYVVSMNVARIGGVGDGQLTDSSLLIAAGWIGVGAVAGIVAGTLIGRKMWR